MGLNVYVDEHLIEKIPDGDWSACRSPARARRRWLKKKYPQHVRWERPSRSVFILEEHAACFMRSETLHEINRHANINTNIWGIHKCS